MPKRVSLTVLENGPIKLSSEAVSLNYCGESVDVEAGKDLYLCRCGGSKNPPFCDGSHSKNGFDGGSLDRPLREIRVWEGKTIRTFFNPNTCMHVFYCKPLKQLRERELAGDEAAAAEIARVVRSCPSGALAYESQSVADPDAAHEVQIDIMEGGELRVQCDFEINAELQEHQSSDRATLCRCGLSKNKPWCDGRHKKRDDFR
jgi:CDGSH-type Zn-finger protein